MPTHPIVSHFACDRVPERDRPALEAYRALAELVDALRDHPEKDFALRELLNSRNAVARLLQAQHGIELEQSAMRHLLGLLPPPRPLRDRDDAEEELSRIDEVSDPAQMPIWNSLTANVTCSFLTMLVARARAVAEITTQTDRWKSIFSRFPAYAKSRPTGWINGLMVAHGPKTGTWTEDARLRYEALQRIIA